MFGWMQSLFLDEKARKALSAPKAAAPKAIAPKPVAPKAVALRPAPGPTDERAQLLRQAMEVHRAKRTILDHLSDEDRARLLSMAILTFLNQGSDTDPKTRT